MSRSTRVAMIGLLLAGLASVASFPAVAATEVPNTTASTVVDAPQRAGPSAAARRGPTPGLRSPIAEHEATSVIKAGNGGEILLKKQGQGCEGAISDVRSGAVSDSTPGFATTLNYSVAEDCTVRITEARSGVPVSDLPASQTPRSAAAASDLGTEQDSGAFTPNTVWGNFIRSSQTLQDVVNIDIAKLKTTHDRQWDDYWNDTRFKADGENSPNMVRWSEASTSVSWNHVSGVYFDGAETYWRTDSALSWSHGDYHSDFLWCNYEPGQNFWLQTALISYPGGGYDSNFFQSRVCSGTHMATSKWTSISYPPF